MCVYECVRVGKVGFGIDTDSALFCGVCWKEASIKKRASRDTKTHHTPQQQRLNKLIPVICVIRHTDNGAMRVFFCFCWFVSV